MSVPVVYITIKRCRWRRTGEVTDEIVLALEKQWVVATKDIICWTRTQSKRLVVRVDQRAGIGANIVATLQISVAYDNRRKEGEEKGGRTLVGRHGGWGM